MSVGDQATTTTMTMALRSRGRGVGSLSEQYEAAEPWVREALPVHPDFLMPATMRALLIRSHFSSRSELARALEATLDHVYGDEWRKDGSAPTTPRPRSAPAAVAAPVHGV